jgi:hypothetical protein
VAVRVRAAALRQPSARRRHHHRRQFDDWAGNLEPVGSTPMSMQIVNDGAFLYLRLSASDAGTRMEITRLGMTVWFDPSGGTKKKLGIRYPVVEGGHLRRW